MTITVRPGKYLVEKTRRRIVGVIAKVGTGGSIPGPAQEALDQFIQSLAAGHSGGEAKTIIDTERETIRAGMKRMQGTWLILSSAGLRWIAPSGGLRWEEDEKAINKALKGTGWTPPAAQVNLLTWGNKGEGRRSSKRKSPGTAIVKVPSWPEWTTSPKK